MPVSCHFQGCKALLRIGKRCYTQNPHWNIKIRWPTWSPRGNIGWCRQRLHGNPRRRWWRRWAETQREIQQWKNHLHNTAGFMWIPNQKLNLKIICYLLSLQIKTIFQEKQDYKLNFEKFTVTVYLWSWRHWCQLRWAASAGKRKNEIFLLLQLLLLLPNATQ